MKSKKTSILFDTLLLDNPHTGIATYCRHLGMAFLSEKFNLLPTYYLREKTDCSFPSSQLFYWKRHHKYFLHLPSSTDLIHCTFQLAKYFGNNTFKRQKKVLTVHDLNFLYESYKHPNAMKRLKKNAKKADHIVCISKFVYKDLLKNLDINPKKVSVIYNGVEQYSQIIHSPKVLPHKPFIFTIGSITRKKNFHTLLPLLVDRDMILVLAGHLVEKDYQKFIIHVAEKLKVEHQIIWVGGISENDKSWYYKNCYAFAFPSLAEGFGLPVIEAMHYGKPCFISNKTSLPEIGGDCAFYFECFEPVYMNQIFDKKMKYYQDNSPQKSIQAWAKRFCWAKSAESYINLYQKLLEKRL